MAVGARLDVELDAMPFGDGGGESGPAILDPAAAVKAAMGEGGGGERCDASASVRRRRRGLLSRP
jgi:hypothetical protein